MAHPCMKGCQLSACTRATTARTAPHYTAHIYSYHNGAATLTCDGFMPEANACKHIGKLSAAQSPDMPRHNAAHSASHALLGPS